MAVLYRLYQNNRKNSEFSGKWYARSVMTNTIDTAAIAERIQRNCTVKKSDVVAVLTELVEVMKDELQNSHSIKLDGFGFFRIGLHTAPANTAADFYPSDDWWQPEGFEEDHTVHHGSEDEGSSEERC